MLSWCYGSQTKNISHSITSLTMLSGSYKAGFVNAVMIFVPTIWMLQQKPILWLVIWLYDLLLLSSAWINLTIYLWPLALRELDSFSFFIFPSPFSVNPRNGCMGKSQWILVKLKSHARCIYCYVIGWLDCFTSSMLEYYWKEKIMRMLFVSR